MRVVLIGIDPQSYIFGSLFSSLGIEVLHYVSNKKTLIKKNILPTKVILDHYYPKNGKFVKQYRTQSFYKPKLVSVFPKNVDLCVFAGCYDQIITHLKYLSTKLTKEFKTINCLVQMKSWKSLEYLQTIFGTNPTFWISPMVEGYFVDEDDYRCIRGAYIKKVALQIDSLNYKKAVNFALLLAEILRIDFFEVINLLQPNRVFVSLYTPFVLYIIKHMKNHWAGDKTQIKSLNHFFENTQPFLYQHIVKNGPFKEVKEFANIYQHKNENTYDLITKIVNKNAFSIHSTFIQSTLRNKYKIDEAIDLATEMIRWYAYFQKDVKGLKSLFDEKRIIWESPYLKEFKLSNQSFPKTLLLEKTEK